MFYGCPFTYDPPRGLFYIRNDSDEAIYVYFKCGNVDSLPSYPKLELFNYLSMDMKDASGNPITPYFSSPEYRINAYNIGSITIWGSRKHPRLPCEEDEVTLFFITELTMRNYEWEEIQREQMFTKRIALTKEEIEKNDWKYTYYP